MVIVTKSSNNTLFLTIRLKVWVVCKSSELHLQNIFKKVPSTFIKFWSWKKIYNFVDYYKIYHGNVFVCLFYETRLVVMLFFRLILCFQEDLTKETLLKQFKIVKNHTNTSHVQQFGNKVREKNELCWKCSFKWTEYFSFCLLLGLSHPAEKHFGGGTVFILKRTDRKVMVDGKGFGFPSLFWYLSWMPYFLYRHWPTWRL